MRSEVTERYGGVGCTVTELALAAEEFGRALAPSPLLATCALAAPLILALGTDEQRTALLPPLATGELTAALAVPGPRLAAVLGLAGAPPADWAGGGRAGGVQARRTDAGWTLYGPLQSFGDASLIVAGSDVDGMCRPLGYQGFVFVGDVLAGTIAPAPMDSRSDGAETEAMLTGSRAVYEQAMAILNP